MKAMHEMTLANVTSIQFGGKRLKAKELSSKIADAESAAAKLYAEETVSKTKVEAAIDNHQEETTADSYESSECDKSPVPYDFTPIDKFRDSGLNEKDIEEQLPSRLVQQEETTENFYGTTARDKAHIPIESTTTARKEVTRDNGLKINEEEVSSLESEAAVSYPDERNNSDEGMAPEVNTKHSDADSKSQQSHSSEEHHTPETSTQHKTAFDNHRATTTILLDESVERGESIVPIESITQARMKAMHEMTLANVTSVQLGGKRLKAKELSSKIADAESDAAKLYVEETVSKKKLETAIDNHQEETTENIYENTARDKAPVPYDSTPIDKFRDSALDEKENEKQLPSRLVQSEPGASKSYANRGNKSEEEPTPEVNAKHSESMNSRKQQTYSSQEHHIPEASTQHPQQQQEDEALLNSFSSMNSATSTTNDHYHKRNLATITSMGEEIETETENRNKVDQLEVSESLLQRKNGMQDSVCLDIRLIPQCIAFLSGTYGLNGLSHAFSCNQLWLKASQALCSKN